MLVRPFQVTPPWQKFRALGGVSEIRDLAWRDGAVWVNETMRLIPWPAPAEFAALRFDEGLMIAQLQGGALPGAALPATAVHDPFGYATGALGFALALQAQQSFEATICCSGGGAPDLDEPAFDWRKRLRVDQWRGNGWATEAIQALLTRDCADPRDALRSGAAARAAPLHAFVDPGWRDDERGVAAHGTRAGSSRIHRWYAPHQRADGFVPCCVDSEGTDWLVEHDSHGQLLALLADYHRFTADDDFLRESWLYVERAVLYIERALEPDGLMPISVSHEGYLAQPVHSYWDDFWTLRGLRDAVSARAGAWPQRLGAALAAARDALCESLCSRRSKRPACSASSRPFRRASSGRISIRRRPRMRSRCSTYPRRSTAPPSSEPSIPTSRIFGESAPARSTRRATRPMKSASSARSCAWEGATRHWSCCGSSSRIAGRRHGINGRKSPGATVRLQPISATCRTPGLRPNMCSRCAACLPTSENPIAALVLAAGLAPEWIGVSGVLVERMPTLYGKSQLLALRARRLDAAIRHRKRRCRQIGVAAAAAPPLHKRDRQRRTAWRV